MDNTFKATDGSSIPLDSNLAQLKIEHVLQRDRDVWSVIGEWPYLAIERERVLARIEALDRFPVFSSGQLWQNLRKEDLGPRLLGMLGGGGTNAGFGTDSRAFVAGKANAKASLLLNWNAPLVMGSTPWCALGTHLVYMDGANLFQHELGKLIVVDKQSRPSSPHFDFTRLADLRDRYNAAYLNGSREAPPDLDALSTLIDETFEQNRMSLAAAEAFHASASVGMTSVDYEAPVLTKYDRLAHDASGHPKVEVSFALLHYEKAILEFNAMKTAQGAGRRDDALVHGVYCVVAAAACVEAIANKLVYIQTGEHPARRDTRTPLVKINDAATALVQQAGGVYEPLDQDARDVLDALRLARNGFMHAKELEKDIDPETSTSVVMTEVNEEACRRYLRLLRLAMVRVFSQLPNLAPPIVIRDNVTWMGEHEVP
ncbi:hypothetical protein ISF74_07885 [Burkholderia pseudomallei]|nr:hypothetical protein [Burkholderia pseudomallei]